ncbi:hypothetical protein WJX79_008419 [Trebouxia sp. C0005]
MPGSRVVWRNQPEYLEQLLKEGAAADALDGESGWTALHRAFYWGNFRCAALLLAANAHLSLTDHKGRTALDLLSEELKVFMEHEQPGLVYSWGNGANYQLGTGATGLQAGPVRLDALRKALVVQVAAAKYHSAAVTKDGQLFTWGFGRGGRLGHPDFHVHSGESAIIVPRAVTGLGRRQVAVVAVAKHHTAVATTSCELFTWGSNRDGRLGYAAVDTQPTPRKVTSLKQRVTAVAAANKHTAILTDAGAIFSWGSNDQGQLGYGTSDSASNALPRQVEAMKGKRLVAVAAAKRHMVVMSSDGDIYTWGHRVVTPRRVQLSGARDVARAGAVGDIAFHKGQTEISRPHAIAIAAGAAHSCCLTRGGVVLAWRSWDANLAVQEVCAGLAGKRIVSISAGKYRTAAVTDEGDVYMWEGLSKQQPHRKRAAKDASLPPRPDKAASRKLSLSDIITPERVDGLKRVSKACVGEKHSLALQSWCHSPKQLRLPILAAAAALPTDTSSHQHMDAEESAELAAQAQEDAEWTAAADRSIDGGPAAATRGSSSGGAVLRGGEGVVSSGEESHGDGVGAEWLGRDFWVGLESAHKKIQAARVSAEAHGYYQADSPKADSMPSLQRLCERSLAQHAVEPRTCLQIMEYADACGAEVLKQFCLGIALSNLDTVLLEARGVLESIGPHLLAEMEDIQKAQFDPACPALPGPLISEAESALLSRRPTAAVSGDEGLALGEAGGRRSSLVGQALVPSPSNVVSELHKERSFCNPEDTEEAAAIGRQIRNLKKKLQQIDALEARRQDSQLDPQQQAKLAQRAEVCAALQALQGGASLEEAQKAALSQRALLPSTSASCDSAAAAVATTKPSAWGSSAAASSSVASLRVSGFETPLGHRAEGSAWCSPVGAPMPSPAPLSSSMLGTPPSTGAAKKTKPARKGGLSMFLSGELEKAATPPPPPPPPPTPAADFSWGAPKHAQSAQSLTSLRDIQTQEAAVTHKAELPRSGSQPSGLSNGRSKVPKQDTKDRHQAVDLLFDGNRVPLEALVRKSSPIAMVKKEEPAEPQGPAWGGVLAGASPPGLGTEGGGLQEAKPRLSDIQAEQERVRESCSRSFGAAGSSPSSVGRDGFATFLQWRGGSGGNNPAAGSSPGMLFPAGTSPHTAKKMYTPSPQQNSKWYINEDRPVVALQDIQSEEYSRELQAQQEAAAAKLQAEEAAAAAAAQKALKKKQRQQRQARVKAAKDRAAHAADSMLTADQAQPQSSSSPEPNADCQPAESGTDAKPLQDGRQRSSSTAANRSGAQKGSDGKRKAKTQDEGPPVKPILDEARTAGKDTPRQRSTAPVGHDGGKPRVLEVRRPRHQFARRSAGDASSRNASEDKAQEVQADAHPQQQLHM